MKYISILDKIDLWLNTKVDKSALLRNFDSDKYESKFTVDPDLHARQQNSNECLGIMFNKEERDRIATLTSWPCDKKKRLFCHFGTGKYKLTVPKAKLPCISSKRSSNTVRNKRSHENLSRSDDNNDYGRNLKNNW